MLNNKVLGVMIFIGLGMMIARYVLLGSGAHHNANEERRSAGAGHSLQRIA
jgi:hypothetical protein